MQKPETHTCPFTQSSELWKLLPVRRKVPILLWMPSPFPSRDSWRNFNSLGFIVLRSLLQSPQKALQSLSVQRCKNINRGRTEAWKSRQSSVQDTGHPLSSVTLQSLLSQKEKNCNVNLQGRASGRCTRSLRDGYHECITNVS